MVGVADNGADGAVVFHPEILWDDFVGFEAFHLACAFFKYQLVTGTGVEQVANFHRVAQNCAVAFLTQDFGEFGMHHFHSLFCEEIGVQRLRAAIAHGRQLCRVADENNFAAAVWADICQQVVHQVVCPCHEYLVGRGLAANHRGFVDYNQFFFGVADD